jgi:glycosyltransferase involved in cell wall biosynthesis
MILLHVLNGLYAGGIEALASQLIANTPAGVRSELLNTNSYVQDQHSVFAKLQRNGQLAELHEWQLCDRFKLAWLTFKLCCHRRPSALLIYPCSRPMVWLALGARLAGVKIMAVHLGNTAPKDLCGLHAWHRLLCWLYRLGVLAVPCSIAIVDSLHPLPRGLQLGPVIHNGCDVNAIAERAASARACRSSGDIRRILMVARLDPIKDQGTLLRAFAAVRQPGWHLQLVGDGPERERLEILASELGLDPENVFLGRRSDIPELLGKADLFAFSTTTAEGFGIALIEAMAAGLPILASDVPACREVLKDGTSGYLVPAGEVEAWIDALHQLMTSQPLRSALANNASSQASTYDSRITAKRWIEVLRA